MTLEAIASISVQAGEVNTDKSRLTCPSEALVSSRVTCIVEWVDDFTNSIPEVSESLRYVILRQNNEVLREEILWERNAFSFQLNNQNARTEVELRSMNKQVWQTVFVRPLHHNVNFGDSSRRLITQIRRKLDGVLVNLQCPSSAIAGVSFACDIVLSGSSALPGKEFESAFSVEIFSRGIESVQKGTTTFLQDGQFRISATVLRQGSTQVRLLFLGKPILSSPPRLVEISHRIPLLRKSNVVCDESVIPRVDEMFFCTVTFQDGGRQHLVASEHISSPSSLSLRVL